MLRRWKVQGKKRVTSQYFTSLQRSRHRLVASLRASRVIEGWVRDDKAHTHQRTSLAIAALNTCTNWTMN